MKKTSWNVVAAVCAFATSGLLILPAAAQAPEAQPKPPMYSYVANWQIPRAHWGEMAAVNAGDKVILDKALADGTIVGYGSDETLVHRADGATHDGWWSAMSMGGLMKVLERMYASPNATGSTLQSSTKHWDGIYVSRYYNWKPGAYKGAYIRVASYTLRPGAPDGAVDTLSQQIVVPLLEKMVADGTIQEYEIDTEAVHTESPSTFWIIYETPKAEGLDTVDAAITESLKANPLSGPAFLSMVDFSAHRDDLGLGEGIYK